MCLEQPDRASFFLHTGKGQELTHAVGSRPYYVTTRWKVPLQEHTPHTPMPDPRILLCWDCKLLITHSHFPGLNSGIESPRKEPTPNSLISVVLYFSNHHV